MKSILKANAMVLALALLVSAQVLAQATNVTGEWNFNVTTDQGGRHAGHHLQAGWREAHRQVRRPAGQRRPDRHR